MYDRYKDSNPDALGSEMDLVGTKGYASTMLKPGQYVAFGTNPNNPNQPNTPITTNIPRIQESLGPTIARPVPAMPQVGVPQSPMSPIRVGQSSPSRAAMNPQINPTGREMSDIEAMVRGQALRGEGMSVAAAQKIRRQIQSEEGQITSRDRAIQEEAEMNRIQSNKERIENIRAGSRKDVATIGVEGRKDVAGMNIESRKTLQDTKLAADKALTEYKTATVSGNVQAQIDAKAKAIQDTFAHAEKMATDTGKIIGTPEHDQLVKEGVDKLKAAGIIKTEGEASKVMMQEKNKIALKQLNELMIQGSMLSKPEDKAANEVKQSQLRQAMESNMEQYAQAIEKQKSTPAAMPEGVKDKTSPTITPDIINEAVSVVKRIPMKQADELYLGGKWTPEQYKNYQMAYMINKEQEKKMRQEVKDGMGTS
jgi:hypothetical protein